MLEFKIHNSVQTPLWVTSMKSCDASLYHYNLQKKTIVFLVPGYHLELFDINIQSTRKQTRMVTRPQGQRGFPPRKSDGGGEEHLLICVHTSIAQSGGSHLCFSSLHIVRILTSKLPLISLLWMMFLINLSCDKFWVHLLPYNNPSCQANHALVTCLGSFEWRTLQLCCLSNHLIYMHAERNKSSKVAIDMINCSSDFSALQNTSKNWNPVKHFASKNMLNHSQCQHIWLSKVNPH